MGLSSVIYEPKGRAGEYGELALNIYTGCPHRCAYCFAPAVLRKDRESFHSHVEPRKNIVEEVKKQLGKGYITYKQRGGVNMFGEVELHEVREPLKNKLIHICFSCDPYPYGYDTTPTREIIRAIKESGNHVQILTKNGAAAERDFDLLDKNDSFGVTFTGIGFPNPIEPNCNDYALSALSKAHNAGIRTWISCEPVLYAPKVRLAIQYCGFVDTFKFGKLNYHKPEDFGLDPIDWAEFGRECERLCMEHGRNYYIKEDLRAEMNR